MEEKLLLGLNRHRREEDQSDQLYGDSRPQSHSVGIQTSINNSPQEPL